MQHSGHGLTLTLQGRGGSWIAFVRGCMTLLDKPLEELCPWDRSALEKKEQVSISSLQKIYSKPGV